MKYEELGKIPDLYTKAINYVFEFDLVPQDGLWLEFGVHAGGTLNRIAVYKKEGKVYGFDSFEGLPEAWEGRIEENGGHYPKHAFSLGGHLPTVLPNVELIKGWFCHTLPSFMSQYQEPITFLHIDSDIYSSAKDIFKHTASKIANGCIIVFDELVYYPGWEKHEWKAWWEFVEEHNITFQWIGGNASKTIKENPNPVKFDRTKGLTENVSPSHENVAVKIINNPSFT